MDKLNFNKTKIESLIKKSFPNATLKNYHQFSTGLTTPAFKVSIINPKKILVVKLTKISRKEASQQNNKILNYLNKYKIPAPKVFFNGIIEKKFITVMDYSLGNVANKVYKKTNSDIRKKILKNVGKTLRSIHKLKIPSFWVHQHHEINSKNEWKKWTRQRIRKYLKFFKKRLSNHYDFLEKELNTFLEILEKEKIDFVPLHWDYHLSNINVNYKGGVTGVFDFDNAIKGHSLGDLGQTAYWLRFETGNHRNFESFLKGYKQNFTQKELKLIRGYFILHLLAVSRTIWFKKKRLGWIIDKHKEILEEFKKGNF